MTALYLTLAAKSSLLAIGRYTEKEWGTAKRDEYLRGFDTCFRNLLKHPHKGQIRDDVLPELRSYPYERHIVYYLYRKKTIVIVDVLHERMDPVSHIAP